MPSSSEIKTFLEKVKLSLKNKNYKILDQRTKFISTLSLLGILEIDVIADLLELSEHDGWEKKPDDNPLFPGDVWICKKNLHGQRIYIKLKIKSNEKGLLLVMSYHIDSM